MKSLLFTFALLLTGASVFAANDVVNPVTDDNTVITIIDATLEVDPICYSTTISAGGSLGPVSGSVSVTVTGCGETAAEAWANFTAALGFAQQQ